LFNRREDRWHEVFSDHFIKTFCLQKIHSVFWITIELSCGVKRRQLQRLVGLLLVAIPISLRNCYPSPLSSLICLF
jgi:hypothetical protein